MFHDGRSKRVIFLAHCLLNQNAISDGTAVCPAAFKNALQLLLDAGTGIIQMPCPELCCLGLDRGDSCGTDRPAVVENTGIRQAMQEPPASERLAVLAGQVLRQITEYHRHGFEILGIVGANRSPTCGVETTSDHGEEIEGRGLFIEAIAYRLAQESLAVPMVGVKRPEDAAGKIKALL